MAVWSGIQAGPVRFQTLCLICILWQVFAYIHHHSIIAKLVPSTEVAGPRLSLAISLHGISDDSNPSSCMQHTIQKARPMSKIATLALYLRGHLFSLLLGCIPHCISDRANHAIVMK
jgi:hypothetical protein